MLNIPIIIVWFILHMKVSWHVNTYFVSLNEGWHHFSLRCSNFSRTDLVYTCLHFHLCVVYHALCFHFEQFLSFPAPVFYFKMYFVKPCLQKLWRKSFSVYLLHFSVYWIHQDFILHHFVVSAVHYRGVAPIQLKIFLLWMTWLIQFLYRHF